MDRVVNPVFEQTYDHYLQQIQTIRLTDIAADLGATVDSEALCIELYGRPYRVSHQGIIGPHGENPGHDICVILFKYILRCPPTPPDQGEWVAFKDFKDAAPLVSYFANDVLTTIAGHFTGRLAALEKASDGLGATPSSLTASYDLCRQMTALPKVPVILLFNDADPEFSATCTLLFQRSTETYLDAECIAMLGRRLYKELRLNLE